MVELSFWDHLVELTKRMRVILVSLIVSTIVVMTVPVTLDFTSFLSTTNPFYPTMATLVIRDFQQKFLPPEAQLLPMSPFAPMEVYMLISVVLGVVISTPVISYELYKFLNPALHKHERKAALQFVASFAGLFIFGFMLGYLYIVPTTIRTAVIFSKMLGLSALLYSFNEFFSMVSLSLLLSSMIFTFPIYIVLLVKVGILHTRQLTKNRKYLYGGVLILIAFLDPEPGLVTEGILFIPIIILLETSIIIAKRIEKKREAAT